MPELEENTCLNRECNAPICIHSDPEFPCETVAKHCVQGHVWNSEIDFNEVAMSHRYKVGMDHGRFYIEPYGPTVNEKFEVVEEEPKSGIGNLDLLKPDAT